MRRGIAFGFCSALLVACAADLRDDVKEVTNNSAVTTSAVATTTTWSNQHLSEVEDDEPQTTATTSVDSSPATTRLQSSDNRQQAAEFWAPYRGTPIPEATFAAPRLALKIDNAPAAVPQQGIQEADLVFEELVEGGLTRFLAIFHTRVPETAGPVRSGRSTDIPLLMPFDGALFGWSGANWAFRKLLDSVAVTDVGVYRKPSDYWRRTDRPTPSDLWAHSEKLLRHAPDDLPPAEPIWPFRDLGQPVTSDAEPTDGVDVTWGSTDVSFRWAAALGGWQRFQNGEQHLVADDEGDLVTLAPENVVVQFTKYILSNEIDSNGARIPIAQLTEGEGRAWILTDGKVIEGRWNKPNITVHTQFTDATGRAVAMAPGSTWILLVPRDAATLINEND
ncbi:MAG: DUF3048 domain-containing protein [Actinomycetota bacterium]|nr:DUF3048 domain-containing protein [Actinomycetota bacterium]